MGSKPVSKACKQVWRIGNWLDRVINRFCTEEQVLSVPNLITIANRNSHQNVPLPAATQNEIRSHPPCPSLYSTSSSRKPFCSSSCFRGASLQLGSPGVQKLQDWLWPVNSCLLCYFSGFLSAVLGGNATFFSGIWMWGPDAILGEPGTDRRADEKLGRRNDDGGGALTVQRSYPEIEKKNFTTNPGLAWSCFKKPVPVF